MAILLPKWLDISAQVRLQMCLKICMAKIAVCIGSPRVEYDNYLRRSTIEVGYVVYLDLIQLNPGLDSFSNLQSGRNCNVYLGAPYNLRFVPHKFLDTSTEAAGHCSWNPAMWLLKLP
jgi:hypothetical protein